MGTGPIKHVVLFKFKEGTSDAKKAEFIEGYKNLTKKIDDMKHFEWGKDVSVEGMQKGYSHCFITTFADADGRGNYIIHDAHQSYVENLMPYTESILVLDFIPEVVK